MPHTREGTGRSGQSKVEFVVLRHNDREGTHYDLMIDAGESLATWKCARPPETARDVPVACRRIGDHRRIYLDYEGPISSDRGHVQQHDRGQCTLMSQSPDRWRVDFDGQSLMGSYEFSRIIQDAWELRSLSPNHP